MQSLASNLQKIQKFQKVLILVANLVSILETIGGVKQDNEELDKIIDSCIKKLKVGIDNMLQSPGYLSES